MARKYICVQQHFQFSSSLHFTCNEEVSFNKLKPISFKVEKKTSSEAQSEGDVKATCPIGENESKKKKRKKMLHRKREISATPIRLHLKEMHGKCYPRTLAPNPEMNAITCAGKTFGRCQ